MKTEFDNTENEALNKTDVKCRFFAQYWEQKVVAHLENLETIGVKEVRYEPRTVINFSDIDNCCLVLKQLKEISNEDSIKIAEIFGIKEDHLFFGKFLCNCMFDNSADCEENVLFNSNAKAIDYLRSKGYAIPFMEYSISDLISFGWVRLL
jgi:hypothetical protein